VQAWIQKTLTAYEKDAEPIASMRFARLPLYFDHTLLESTKFIPIDRVPMPPLSAIGLSRFAAFEQGDFNGVTYLDRYFIKRTLVTEEAIHFHELIHAIQWRVLGPEGFLAAYEFGYESNSLEKMAYDAEASFKRSAAIFAEEEPVPRTRSLRGLTSTINLFGATQHVKFRVAKIPEIAVPPVRMTMSSSMALRQSPKPGALTAATFKVLSALCD
jgi:hypothetical protein